MNSQSTIQLVLQPPRSYNQKRRLAARLRGKGRAEEDVKRICWHPENSPYKGHK